LKGEHKQVQENNYLSFLKLIIPKFYDKQFHWRAMALTSNGIDQQFTWRLRAFSRGSANNLHFLFLLKREVTTSTFYFFLSPANV
jgi:hypothetical protein